MQLPILNKKAERVVAVSLLLSLISVVAVVALFLSSKHVNKENMMLMNYLTVAEQVRPNFEASLKIYTENIEDSIQHVHSIRPSTELEYIEFIAEVEGIADELQLDINLRSLDLDPRETESVLPYELSFNGSRKDMMDYLNRLEYLPYYIRVNSLDYVPLQNLAESNDGRKNTRITLDLYVK